jgi:opacity protein-like surface antigen
MKSLPVFFSVFFVMAALIGLFNTSAYGESTKGKLGLGLRGGPSGYTQELNNGYDDDQLGIDEPAIDGNVGALVSGIITYGIKDFLSLGMNVEWEKHDSEDFPGGNINTVSLLPLVELRKNLEGWTPYVFAGAGLNINWVDESRFFESLHATIDPDNTFAFKVGTGFDYFFTPRWAFNTELGWKWNDGEYNIKQFGNTVLKQDFHASTLSAIFGLRAYF